MTIYIGNIAITLFFCLISILFKNQTRRKKDTIYDMLPILLLWVALYALRDNVGSDYEGYHFFFNRIGDLQQTFLQFYSEQRDFLFAILEYYTYQIFHGNWVVFLTILGVLTYFPVLCVIYKESESPTMSTLLYIFTMLFYSGYNGIRQSIAVSLAFWSYYKYFKTQKYKLYVCVILIAMGFHSTAIFVVPFHLLSNKKVTANIFKIVITFMLFSYAFLWQLWGYLINFLDWIGQHKLASDYAYASHDGSGLLRMFVYWVPAILGIMFYNKLKEKYAGIDREIILLIIAATFMLLSTKYWLFARVAEYFYIHVILFVPKLEVIFKTNSKKLGVCAIAFLYFAYMYAMLLHGEGGYLPYNFMSFS